MLKGKTTMTVSKATVIAAVQAYLDDTFSESHVVVDVKADTSGYNGSGFVIDLDDGAKEAKADQ